MAELMTVRLHPVPHSLACAVTGYPVVGWSHQPWPDLALVAGTVAPHPPVFISHRMAFDREAQLLPWCLRTGQYWPWGVVFLGGG